MFNRLLIVCVGNVCRSPTAEFLFRKYLASTDLVVESAGLAALVGKPMDDMAARVMGEHGVDASPHHARQVTASMLRGADLVLAMERSHVSRLMTVAPESSGKVMLFDRWNEGRDIPDPFHQSREAFVHVFEAIDSGVKSWLPRLGCS